MSEITIKELPNLIPGVRQIAEDASQEIMKVYETDFSVDHKEDESPLTAADMAAHKTICAGLAALTPDTPVLSEESAEIPYSERKQWQQYWLVDPLDGTREFVKRNGEFTVNIALIEDGKPILSVITIPVSGIHYYAAKGTGAYKAMSNSAAEQIHVRKTIKDKITLAGSRSHGTAEQQAFIEQLSDAEIIAKGSSLKFCLVAEGAVDIYPRFGPTSEWDTAAAQCIVEEAGGKVTDMQFKPLRYNTKDSLLNPHFLVIADPDFNWQQFLD